jgi:hypothetical protein
VDGGRFANPENDLLGGIADDREVVEEFLEDVVNPPLGANPAGEVGAVADNLSMCAVSSDCCWREDCRRDSLLLLFEPRDTILATDWLRRGPT